VVRFTFGGRAAVLAMLSHRATNVKKNLTTVMD
jgi:hypothetical protein